MAITGTLKSGYNGQIYGGPELSTTTYEPVGTISTSQTVLVIWAERPSSVSYCLIEFTDSSTSKKKRGYIPQNYLTLTGGTPVTKTLTSTVKRTNSSQNIIYGPGSLNVYNLRGSVSVNDFFIQLATEGSYSFIEYVSVVGNRKRRGYILSSLIVTAEDSMATTFPSSCFGSGSPFYPRYVGECTWYCWGRAKELRRVTTLPTGDARDWYSNAPSSFEKVSDPVKNSIACWGSNHVVYVEDIIGGTVYFSEANYYAREDPRRSNGVCEPPPDGTDGQIKTRPLATFKSRQSGYQGCIVL